jgi:putative oxidoreductase
MRDLILSGSVWSGIQMDPLSFWVFVAKAIWDSFLVAAVYQCLEQQSKMGGIRMNSILARSSHLFPSMREAWYAIPLRLIVGYGFIEHGHAKLARGPDNFANILHALGIPAPTFLSWATVLVELLGGLAVLVGAFIPLASVPMTVILLVAIFTVHLPYGFSSIELQTVTAAGAHFGQPGYETDLLYLAGLTALVLGGSGPFALDRLVRRASDGR